MTDILDTLAELQEDFERNNAGEGQARGNWQDEIDAMVAAQDEVLRLRAEVTEMRDTVNEVWASLYPGAVPVTDLFALRMRVRNIAEDRNCWAFNTRVLQKQVNEMEARHEKQAAVLETIQLESDVVAATPPRDPGGPDSRGGVGGGPGAGGVPGGAQPAPGPGE